MRNITTALIALIIVAVLACYMLLFRVNYDEVAVKTTWGAAERPTGQVAEGENDNSLFREPGLYFKLPWPINKVYTYSTKVQLLEIERTQLLTADQASVVLQTYLTYRITDPYQFFVTFGDNEAEARGRLATQMQSVLEVFSSYRLDQMVNTDPQQLKLDQIEAEAKDQLAANIAAQNYGITIEQVGIRRLIFPETTTEQVFERMRSTRQRLAESARQEGENRAVAIRAEAERVKDQILSFANTEASKIRSEGLQEGAENYDAFAANTELAVFLRQVDTLKQMLPDSTLILDANALQFLDLLRTPTSAGGSSGNGSGGSAVELEAAE